MKKLVALNAILLAILFSIKFSQEDLTEHLHILTKNGTLFAEQNKIAAEHIQDPDSHLTELEILSTPTHVNYEKAEVNEEHSQSIEDLPNVVSADSHLNNHSLDENGSSKNPVALQEIKNDQTVKISSRSIKIQTWIQKIYAFVSQRIKIPKITFTKKLSESSSNALSINVPHQTIEEQITPEVTFDHEQIPASQNTNSVQTALAIDQTSSLSTDLASPEISQNAEKHGHLESVLSTNDHTIVSSESNHPLPEPVLTTNNQTSPASESNNSLPESALSTNDQANPSSESHNPLSKATDTGLENPAWISKIHSFKSIPIFGAKSESPPITKDTYNPYPIPKRIALSHTEGYGEREKEYRTNYSFLEILLAGDAKPGIFLPMIDLRGYRFDNAKYALSVGFMGRYIPEPNTFCELLGANVYYDYAPGTCGFNNQLGGGLEILGKRWDIRANFYAPLGDNKNDCLCCKHPCFNGWFAYAFNAEVGYLAVRSKSFLLYTAIGPYYITASECEERKRGVMLRVVPQYKDYLALNLKFSYDPVFRAIFQAELIISLPLYQINVPEKAPCGITNRQIYQRVERL